MSLDTFEGVIDRYNGVTVDYQQEKCEINQFSIKLSESMKKWSDENKRCIWFKIHIKDAACVPILATEGFDFHHARDSIVTMYKSLPAERKANLPPACHTNIGVGGMVFNDKNQILVVTENNHIGFFHWKLPGGYVEIGEDIEDAAMREVKEETGIDTAFESLVTFRHTHNAMFGNSDIYIIVMLKALTNTITKCDLEIKECQWMDVEEYLNHPNVFDFNKFIVGQALDLKSRKLKLALKKSTLKIPKITRIMTSLVLEDS